MNDHTARLDRAILSLNGLSVGDAFGASIFIPGQPESLHRPRPLPAAPWYYTDDTEMARGVVEVLRKHGYIDQDDLARAFVRRWEAEPRRGYGPNVVKILQQFRRGIPWRKATIATVTRQRPG